MAQMDNNVNRGGGVLSSCDAIRTLMMLLVVIGHCVNLWLNEGWFIQVPDTTSKVLDFVATYLNQIHVYVFTFVSGYLFYYNRYEKGKYRNTKHDIGARAQRLLIPYFFVSIFWVIPFYIAFYGFDKYKILRNYFLAVSPSQLWFIWMIFVLFILFYFTSDRIVRMDYRIGLCVCIGLYVISFAAIRIVPNYYQIWIALRFFVFYYLGFAERKYSFVERIRMPWICLLAINMLMFLIYYFVLRDLSGVVNEGIAAIFLLFLRVTAVYAVYKLFSDINAERLNEYKMYVFFKNYNFPIYLFHQQLVWVSIVILNGRAPNTIILLSNIVWALLGSSVLAILLEKFKVTRALIGLK